MIIKLILVVLLVVMYFIMSSKPDGKKNYYFLTVLMFMLRDLNVPLLGATTPGAVMAYVLFVATFSDYNGYLRKWSGYALCLAFAVCYSLATNYVVGADRVFWWASNIFIVMVLAIMPQKLFKTEADLVTLARCVLGACFVYSFTTLMGYYGFADGVVIYAGELDEYDSFHASRIYGISDSNLVQTISIISIPLIPWAKLRKKWMETALLLVFILAAVVTIKRMSFLAMIPSLFYYGYYLQKNRAYSKLLIIGVVIFVMMSLFWEAIVYRFGIAGIGGELDDHSTERRYSQYLMALTAFYQSPIWGNGAGFYIYIHNGIYELLCNCGILGVILIFMKYIPSLKSVIRLNPWAYCQVVFLVTCFSLESTINHAQLMAFMGFYLAGYYFSKKYNWNLR
jgi:hypothetical protein